MVCTVNHRSHKNKALTSLVAILIVLLSMVSFGVGSASAATVDEEALKRALTEGDTATLRKVHDVTNDSKKQGELSQNKNYKTITVTDKNGETKTYMYDTNSISLQSTLESKDNAAKVDNKINDITGNIAVEADIQGGGMALSGFVPIINQILGIVVYVVLALFGVYTAFDTFYIGFPLFREKCDSKAQEGGKFSSSERKNGETKFRWVTEDAVSSIEEAATAGVNPWGVYLKKRAITYVIAAITIYILLTGEIGIIIEVALKAISGFMDVLRSLT